VARFKILGSCSGTEPMIDRHHTSIVLEENGRNYFFDAGENAVHTAHTQGIDLTRTRAIFISHSHYDHIGGLTELHTRTGAPVYMHPAEAAIVDTMSCGLLNVTTHAYPAVLHAGGLEITVYHTPGHSPGSVCLLAEDKLITGDTLFFGSCGRIDFVGGSWESMAASLRFLAGLAGNPSVYPGHGESSRLDTERKYNPYLREAMQE